MRLPPRSASFRGGAFFFCAVASQNLYCDKVRRASKYPKIPKIIYEPHPRPHGQPSRAKFIQKPNKLSAVQYIMVPEFCVWSYAVDQLGHPVQSVSGTHPRATPPPPGGSQCPPPLAYVSPPWSSAPTLSHDLGWMRRISLYGQKRFLISLGLPKERSEAEGKTN